MWNKDIRDAMRLHEQVRTLLPSPAQLEAIRAHAQAAREMMPSPEQMEAYRRQAEWARRMAVSVDPATLRALSEPGLVFGLTRAG